MPLVQTDNKSPIAGDVNRWPKLPLNPLHKGAWGETMATMVWAVPSYSDIWLAMMADKDHEVAWFTDCIETCATDDKFLYINPKFFFRLTLDERLFVDCHEIGHAMYGHAGLMYRLQQQGKVIYNDGVSLKFETEVFQSAADYVLNDQLVKAKIGALPKGGLHWPAFINGDMGVLDAYRLLYELQQSSGDKRGHTTNPEEGQGPMSGKSFDKLLKPGEGRGKTPTKAMAERSEPEWDTAITAAMESAKQRGQLPANLARLFGKKLNPQADWRDLFMLAVSRKIGNDRYTWTHLDQQLAFRNIGAPGRTTFGCNLVVVAVDTSGSINQRTLDVFLAETTALLDQARPKQVVFTQCDAQICEWSVVDGNDDLYGRTLKGGGGTAFEPVFERVEAEGLEPDLLVYLTDLDGSFPYKAPSYPVIWGSIDKNKHAPWGEEVFVPPQAENSGE